LQLQRERDGQRGDGQLTGTQLEPGLRVLRPPETSSIVITGLAGSVPSYWDFGPAGLRTGRALTDDHDVAAGIGGADLRYVISIVLGLLAVYLALTSVAGERADGSSSASLPRAPRRWSDRWCPSRWPRRRRWH
jgi:hypothetical protein